jgi:rubrerythrin
MTTEEWIKKAKKIHGNKYDYSKINYINNKIKVCIICPEHGEFWQTPNSHLSGRGCRKCADKLNSERTKFSTNEFIKKAKSIHGDKYDYSKVNYKNIDTKICIICSKHGEFMQTPYAHLQGQGCPICGKIKRNYKMQKTKGGSIENFIKRAKEIHGDKYDYSKVEYKNMSTKVCIICHKHGEYWQIPSSHLQGQGCPVCKESKLENEIRLLLTENNISFIMEAHFNWLKKQHLDFYLPDYNIAIECQGEQHFKPIKHFGGEKKYVTRTKLDENKRILCKENGIKLIYFSKIKTNEIEGIKNYYDGYKIIEEFKA